MYLLENNLIWCGSRKQRTITHSRIEFEYRSLAQASTKIIWLQQLLRKLGILFVNVKFSNVIMLVCSRSLTSNRLFHVRTKHIEICAFHKKKKKVLNKELDVRYISKEKQIANILTKDAYTNHLGNLRTQAQSSTLSLRGVLKGST